MKRESIQQAADKRVAIESLVIRDLLQDLNCQWRWVSSERQLADGLTKTNARQAYIERHRGGYVQLVADEECKAAKKKTKEERKKTIQETQATTSAVARSLIGLVMTEAVKKAEATQEGENVTEDAFEMNAVNVTAEYLMDEPLTMNEWLMFGLVVMIVGWLTHKLVTWMIKQLKNYMSKWYVPKEEWDRMAKEFDQLNYEHGELAEQKKQHDAIVKEMSGLLDAQFDNSQTTHTSIQKLIRERELLQEKVEDLQGEIGLMESRIFDKDEEIAFRAQAMTNLQTAAATYARQVNDLRRDLSRVEHSRFTIYVSRTGHSWHSTADCQYLRGSYGVRTLEACAACTAG